MVELYDLKLVTRMRGNEAPPVSTDLDHWPIGGIDEHIAQLDFETSSIANEESIFSSIAAMDAATLISTDSLDMEQLRQRCETNKNEYKLTFEDSGQWTTSGFGTGTSPSAVAIHLDESEDEHQRQSADLLLNNDDDYPNGTFTTWGHIKSVEPPYDPKTNSMPPSINFRPTDTQTQERRSTSLLANFVERQQLTSNPSPPHDYEYSEQYLGEGHYIDLNSNEIGYAPANTASIQQSAMTPLKRSLPPVPPATQATVSPKDRWQTAHQRTSSMTPPRRTFANLDSNGPDLNFLSLPFKVPSFCRSSASLDKIFRYTQQTDSNPKISSSKTEAFISELLSGNVASVSTATSKLFQPSTPSSLAQFAAPDSGLGSSGGSIGGPAHIEDWNSLSILLPKHVVDTCSFFKSNITLLAGSSSTTNITSNNSMERKSRSTCRVCYGLRSNFPHPADTFARSQRELCNCSVSIEHPNRKFSSLSVATDRREDRRQAYHRRTKLRADELSVIGLPIYDAKRQLIERVVEGVAEVVRGGSSTVLYEALEHVLSDGLRPDCNLWKVIVTVTRPGRATGAIYNTVQQLETSEKSVNSRIQMFFKKLQSLHSLDGYLSYIVLKEKQLVQMYNDNAFLLRAHSAYRSLFWRLIESLELLSVLSQSERLGLTQPAVSQLALPSASRLPRDSRIPKSTSEPLRLSVKVDKGWKTFGNSKALAAGSRSLSTGGMAARRKRSRIPVLINLSQQRSRSVKVR